MNEPADAPQAPELAGCRVLNRNAETLKNRANHAILQPPKNGI